MRHTHLNRSADRRGGGGACAPCPPLVAVAHGSRDPSAAAVVCALARLAGERAARRGLAGLEVHAAYLDHCGPRVSDVLSGLGSRQAVVLPLLLTAAYHSDTDLPRQLGDTKARWPGLRICYGQPLGPHPLLTQALDRRLSEAMPPGWEAEDTSVVLAAAGSSRPDATASVARLARRWQRERGWREVLPAYASAVTPTPADAVAELRDRGARRVAVATYLLAPGRFADQVRDTSLASGAGAVSAVIGALPEVADVLLDRYTEARSLDAGLPVPGRSSHVAAGAGAGPSAARVIRGTVAATSH